MDGDVMARLFDTTPTATGGSEILRLHRMALGLPGEPPRFAEGWLSRMDGGGWLLEAHPVDEFPSVDPTQALPRAPRNCWRDARCTATTTTTSVN
jgi:two-component system, NtrC family, nitrogen regulation sensor histidine kinase GlnL